MTVKSELIQLFTDKNIQFTDMGSYLDIVDKNVRIYPVDNMYDHRFAYYDDVGGVGKKFFQSTSIENEANGIKTIWVKPHEFIEGTDKREVLTSIILSACGAVGTKFNGRDTYVKEVTNKEIRQFLVENSFYGYRSASLSLGLFLKKDVGDFKKDTLVMVYTFGHPFFGGKKKKYDIEVIRAATLRYTQVRGGASKLFTHFVKNYPTVKVADNDIEWNTICYYVDYDHNSGNSLVHLGFSFDSYSGPGFMNVYRDTGVVFHRKPMIHKQIMEQVRRGEVFSVFNAGVKVYIYQKNKDDDHSNNQTA